MNIPLLPKIIQRMIRLIFSCEIPYTCEIHKSVKLAHYGLGVVINANARIEENVIIYQNVTIGNRNRSGAPIIQKGALIGAGACIIGDVIIGKNAKVGSNAVVLNNVPDNATAVGIPAHIISDKNNLV